MSANKTKKTKNTEWNRQQMEGHRKQKTETRQKIFYSYSHKKNLAVTKYKIGKSGYLQRRKKDNYKGDSEKSDGRWVISEDRHWKNSFSEPTRKKTKLKPSQQKLLNFCMLARTISVSLPGLFGSYWIIATKSVAPIMFNMCSSTLQYMA